MVCSRIGAWTGSSHQHTDATRADYPDGPHQSTTIPGGVLRFSSGWLVSHVSFWAMRLRRQLVSVRYVRWASMMRPVAGGVRAMLVKVLSDHGSEQLEAVQAGGAGPRCQRESHATDLDRSGQLFHTV